MLKKAEKEIIYGALYISLNFYKFKNFVKINKPYLYKRIYEPYDEQSLLTQEQIDKIIKNNGFEIIKEIKKAELELSKLEAKGNIKTIEDHIKWMIIHYNAVHTEEPEVQEVLWRPKK